MARTRISTTSQPPEPRRTRGPDRQWDDDPITGIGYRLRQARIERGWTQLRLAKAIGTTQAAIQKIENNKSKRPRFLDELAQILNVPVEWLHSGVIGQTATLSQAMHAGYVRRLL